MNIKGLHWEGAPQGLTPENLYDWVSKNAHDHLPAAKYDEELSDEDLNKFRTEFADKAIELNAQKDEMAEEVKILKKRIKAIETEMAKNLKIIAEKKIEIVEPGFLFKDMEARSMVTVNSEARIIGVRPLEQHELQMHIGMVAMQDKVKKKNGKGKLEVVPSAEDDMQEF